MTVPLLRARTAEERAAYVQGWAAGAEFAAKLLVEQGHPPHQVKDELRAVRALLEDQAKEADE